MLMEIATSKKMQTVRFRRTAKYTEVARLGITSVNQAVPRTARRARTASGRVVVGTIRVRILVETLMASHALTSWVQVGYDATNA